MSPWWSQVWVEHWGVAIFHGLLWPLAGLATWAMTQPRAAARARSAHVAFLALGAGVGLGIALAGVGLLAWWLGQPEHVWGRLLLFGGLYVVIHGSILAGFINRRRGSARAQAGGVT